MHIHRLLYSKYSKLILSILIGFGLATMFRKECKDDSCLQQKGPSIEQIKDKIFKHDNNCYTLSYSSEKCDDNKKVISFA